MNSTESGPTGDGMNNALLPAQVNSEKWRKVPL